MRRFRWFPLRSAVLVLLPLSLAFVHAASGGSLQIFGNNTSITINDASVTPYPSNVTVSGLTVNTATKIQVILSQLSHAFPQDVDVLLVGPQGQRCMLMSDAGGGAPVTNISLTFSSTAATVLPQDSSPGTATYRPANYVNDLAAADLTDPIPGVGVLTDQAADLNVFNLINPNGVWSLYVVDDSSGQTGSIANGWLLLVTVPTVFTVNSTADPGDGVCDATECTLREAINAAIANTGDGDLINFSSLFNTPQTINVQTALPDITESMTIQGPGANLLTVRRDYNAATNFRVFNIPNGGLTVSLSGMTISGGNADNSNGKGNSGGGINCQSNLTLTNVHVTGNQASVGGGVALAFADGTFTNCTFSSNTAASEGGAIDFASDTGRTLHLTNCTVSGNTANGGGSGGGIFHGCGSGNGTLTVVNCTIANNSGANGGGIHTVAGGSAANSATTTLRNTIIANNTPTNFVKATFSGATATVTSLGFNLSDNYNTVPTLTGTDITAQPLLGPLSLNGGQAPTHALLGGSPALDKGDATGTDQRGLPRQFDISTIAPASGGNDSDIGAVEMQALIVNSTADPGDGVCDATCTLRDAITAANANGAGLDDILFSNTVFNTSQTINLQTALPNITSNATLNGPGANLLTVRRDPSAASDFIIFHTSTGGFLGISGMTIAGGRGSGQTGGGISSGATLILTNVHVTGNQSDLEGGGVFLVAHDGVFTGCTFSGNNAIDSAGGGAIEFQGAGGHTLRVVESTISGNLSGNPGGAIENFGTSGDSQLQLVSCTIANNSARNGAGGIDTATEFSGTAATTMLRNTIIADNAPSNLTKTVFGSGGAATFQTLGFNLASDGGGGFLNVAPITTDKINANAGLAALADNGGQTPTHALFSTSAALDAGNSSGSGTLFDQRGIGFNRTVDLATGNAAGSDGTDIGAFEAQTTPSAPPIPIVTSIARLNSNPTTAGSTVQYSVTFSANVTGVDASDFALITSALNGSNITGVVGSGSAYTVSVNVGTVSSSSGTLRLDVVDDDSIIDTNGTRLGGTGLGNGDFTGQVYTVNTAPSPTPTATATATPTATATATATPTATPTPAPGLVGNVSTRLPVGTGDNALIEGFIVQGPAGSVKKILVRAIGPSLIPFGITDAVANPTLDIFDSNNAKIASNDNWKTTQVGGIITGDQFAEINGSGVAPSNDLESAIVANLTPGSYTAVVRGVNNSIGTGVVDAFDLSAASTAKLANVATRGLIQPGDKLMIGGFIVQNGSVRVVVSALGPSLAAFGITNALPDTTLQLRDQNGAIVRENDDWMSDQKAELEATGLQPTNNLEAALVQTIPPGQYTAQVRGKPEATGIGVVQVFFLQ